MTGDVQPPALVLVPGAASEPSARREAKPGRVPLTAEQLEEVRRNEQLHRDLVRVVELVDAAASVPTAHLALRRVERLLELLPDNDPGQMRRLLVLAVVEAVWKMPPAESRVRTDVEILGRQRQLRRWSWERRRTASEALRRLRAAKRSGGRS